MNPMPHENTTSGIAPRKRLIICCDGTWMNSDDGYKKGSKGELQLPSNVTRISRAFRRQCTDNTLQIIYYQNGVGSGNTTFDQVTGGIFGRGISDNIREVYSFICANYCDGDEIVLIGFSRGAFTARSIAGLIGGIGLLTREGLEYFYPILKDVENWKVDGYEIMDEFPEYPPFRDDGDERPLNIKPRFGTDTTGEEYAQLLLKKGLTRMYEGASGKGNPIKTRAVAVWDTVGSLGIPDAALLNMFGLQSTKEYHFYDTSLSSRVDYAFHALALDEMRPPFSPAVWERGPDCQTILKQVWFPGVHADIGGGYEDQQMGDMSLAWMVDQLSSIGVEFKVDEMLHLFRQGKAYYSKRRREITEAPAYSNRNSSYFAPLSGLIGWNKGKKERQWASAPAFAPGRDRCWGLGQIHSSTSFIYKVTGLLDRKPGLYRRVNPKDGLEIEGAYLEGTNETIHPSVRARLACKGLGQGDAGIWRPNSLKDWRLVQKGGSERPQDHARLLHDPCWPNRQEKTETGVDKVAYKVAQCGGDEWAWEYIGVECPKVRVMAEEKIGLWERVLMGITVGLPEVDVYALSEKSPPVWPDLRSPSS